MLQKGEMTLSNMLMIFAQINLQCINIYLTVDWTMNHKDIYKADSLKSDQTVTDSCYTDDQL